MRSRPILIIVFIFTTVLVLAACGTRQESPTLAEQLSGTASARIAQVDANEKAEAGHDEVDKQDTAAQEEAGHDEGAMGANEEGGDQGTAAHGIPEEAAVEQNPITADAASIAAGEAIFTSTCAVCHGDTGLGDGIAGAALDPPPANLHAEHVQMVPDGGIFYTIQNGKGTGMPAWGETLSEEEIWNVVNFIRTFKE